MQSAPIIGTVIPVNLFLIFGGQNLFTIFILGLVFATVVPILSLFIPESPQYLYEKKKFKELRKTMAYIATINGTSMSTYRIKGEDLHLTEHETQGKRIIIL